MRNMDREFIAVSFGNDDARVVPVIKMSGADGLKKIIYNVNGISRIAIHHIDFTAQTTKQLGAVQWPDPGLTSDVIISFRPEEEGGTLTISRTGSVWNYSLSDEDKETAGITDEREPSIDKTLPEHPASVQRDIVDKEKVRQLEQEKEKKILWPDELAERLKKDIYGQDEAITKISELIAGNLRRAKPEVEVIVLFGPTGVGKTEVGRMLPGALRELTGQNYGFQQIALNSFVGEHSVNRFFGSPPSYVGYKDPTIFEPIRSNGYQVYLLDEAEKGTDRLWTGLMECFSSGVVRLADNSPEIDLSHVIFIITSNVPIDMNAYNAATSFRKKEICRDALSKVCGHPEIAGKITNCIAFQPLPADALTDIVSKFVIDELSNYGMELVHMDEELMIELKEQHSSYGARGVRDAVRDALTRATVYDRNIDRYKGKKVKLKGTIEDIEIEIDEAA